MSGPKPLEPQALAYDKPLCASLDGFTLPAATRAGALDPSGREALLRYVLRPPIAQERVEQRQDGLVRITLKKAYADGQSVQAWVVKPASFDPTRRYPLLVLIHGGPQGEWGQSWSYRWNPQVFASAGYVVFMPNPRGSIGWGQEFIDDVSGDWGGRAYEDIVKGTDWAEALPYVEKGRTAAAGASYGGYMVDWIAGHTGRYRVLVSHDGVFDLRSMYGGTEELWFPEWEFHGPYWASGETYEKWSPSNFVQDFKTPTLVVHGEMDYRVPLEQGLGMITALQRRGVPSRLLVFPDEGHWVLQPANSIRWYKEVIGWIDRWMKPDQP